MFENQKLKAGGGVAEHKEEHVKERRKSRASFSAVESRRPSSLAAALQLMPSHSSPTQPSLFDAPRRGSLTLSRKGIGMRRSSVEGRRGSLAEKLLSERGAASIFDSDDDSDDIDDDRLSDGASSPSPLMSPIARGERRISGK